MGQFPSRAVVENLKGMYPEGTRVELDFMDDPWGVPPGTQGTVRFVDDSGTVHVRWDNGSGLGLVYGVDRYHVVAGAVS